MRAGESFPCADCGRTVRRGEPCQLYRGRWTHATSAACLPLEPRPSSVRPFVSALNVPAGGAPIPRVVRLPGLSGGAG